MMNTPSEPDQPFGSFHPAPKKIWSSGTIVAVFGCGALGLFLWWGRGESTSSTGSSGSQTPVKQKPDQARQKELIAYLQEHPEDEFAHYQLGELIRNRAPFQALENFSHVTSAHPHYFDAVAAIADIAQEQDLPDRAKPALQILVREFPEQVAYQEALARLYLEEGRYRRALRYSRRCVELDPDQADNQLLMAEILRKAGRTSEMLAPLKQALFLDPDSYPAHLSMAYAALYTGDLITAEREARWCLEQQPDSTTALRYLATIDRNRGNLEAALRHIDEALQIAPHDFDCLLIKADLLIYQRKGEAAYALLKPLYAEHQTDRHYISALARAAGLTGKREEALQLQKQNQQLIKEDDLRPSSLQSDSVEKKHSQQN
ncbi:tetratricopeptide repeat protein [Gimesia panareensis]|nr:tetratricopeptide repeat protein [Gimesia panareensis]